MSFLLDDLDTTQLIVAANALAIAFAKDLSADDTDILANFITSIGDILALIASSKERLENSEALIK